MQDGPLPAPRTSQKSSYKVLTAQILVGNVKRAVKSVASNNFIFLFAYLIGPAALSLPMRGDAIKMLGLCIIRTLHWICCFLPAPRMRTGRASNEMSASCGKRNCHDMEGRLTLSLGMQRYEQLL